MLLIALLAAVGCGVWFVNFPAIGGKKSCDKVPGLLLSGPFQQMVAAFSTSFASCMCKCEAGEREGKKIETRSCTPRGS